VLKDHHLRVLQLCADGTAVTTQWVRVSDRGRLRVAVMHPTNDSLYLVTDADPGSILRVRPS
jgi:hypothetical protein